MNKRAITLYLLAAITLSCNDLPTKNNSASLPKLCGHTKVDIEGIKKLGPPVKRTNIGNSHLTITTTSAQAQEWFNQGLNLLHGFWHLEAYRAFLKVVELDPACAMGYWGIGMCQPGFSGKEKVWTEAMKKASILSEKTSPLEVALIASGQQLLTQGITQSTISLYKKLSVDFPNNPEIQALSAIMLRQSGTQENNDFAKTILTRSLQKFPEHTAVAHYYTHILETTPAFLEAESHVLKMAAIGHQSPHLVHMPGHIAFLKGDYSAAIKSFKNAKILDEKYHSEEKVPYLTNQNYLHNIHYLAVAYAENGEYDQAIATANKYTLINLKSAIPNIASEYLVHFEGLILPAFVNIRFREWDKAIAYLQSRIYNLDKPLPSKLVKSYFMAMNAYCTGMKLIQENNLQKANASLMEMGSLMEQFNSEGIQHEGKADFLLINEVYDVMEISRLELFGWIQNSDATIEFNVQPFREALLLEENMGYGEPPKLIYPVFESMGLLLQKRGDYRGQEILKEALKLRPKSKVIHNWINS